MSMFSIPEFLVGEERDVRRGTRRLVRANDKPPPSLDRFGPMLDLTAVVRTPPKASQLDRALGTDPVPQGSIIVHAHRGRHAAGAHARVYLLREAIETATDSTIWYEWCLASSWSFLGVLGQGALPFLHGKMSTHQQDFFAAAIRHAPSYDELGRRFLFLGDELVCYRDENGPLHMLAQQAASLGTSDELLAPVADYLGFPLRQD